jgi:hypothetical protein
MAQLKLCPFKTPGLKPDLLLRVIPRAEARGFYRRGAARHPMQALAQSANLTTLSWPQESSIRLPYFLAF